MKYWIFGFMALMTIPDGTCCALKGMRSKLGSAEMQSGEFFFKFYFVLIHSFLFVENLIFKPFIKYTSLFNMSQEADALYQNIIKLQTIIIK